MINFASLFNQYRSSANNSITFLLSQQDVTLAKLIDDDSFLNEYKSGNNKLMEFMKYDKIKQLVDYITIVGPPEDKKRSYKFPLSASDILSTDNSTVIQWFLPQGKIYNEEKYIQDEQVTVEEQCELQSQKNQQTNTTKTQVSETETEKCQQIEKTIIKDTLNGNQEQILERKQNQQNQQKQKSQQNESQKKSINKKIIKVKKTVKVQKVKKIQVQSLINYLFKYFDGEINYILTGYICKVLNSLFSKKAKQMIQFLFTDNNINKLVNQIESRSIGQFLIKVLTYESKDFIKERTSFFRQLLLKIGQNNENYILSNFSSFVCETIEKAANNIKGNNPISEFSTIFFTPQIIAQVIKNVMSDYQNVSVYNSPILLTYLTNVPFTLPQDQAIVLQFKGLLRMFIEKSLQKLSTKIQNRPKLGFGRIKIIQILTYVLKQNLLGSRQIFGSQQKAYSILFDLCKKYQLNNVLHNQVVKIITITLSQKDDSIICQALTKNNVLLNFICEQAEQDANIKAGKSNRKHRKGYIGHIVQICRLIQENEQKGNKVAQQIQLRDEFQHVLSTLVQKQMYESNKSLAGYRMNKNIKHQIMFQKQDIVSFYFDFLNNSPKPVFQPEPEHINIEHPDFVQELQRQIEQNMVIQDSKNENKEQKVLDQNLKNIIEAEIKMHVNFFKGHLDFDINVLMQDL